jgi:two-component system OmpR family sensor kinase
VTSIRRRLLVALLAAVAAVTLTAAFLVYRRVLDEIDTISDYHLRQVALTLRDRMPGGVAVTGRGGGDFDFVIQIWDRDGTKLYLSKRDSGLPKVAELGFATVRSDTGEWRVYSADLEGIVIQVAQPLKVRQERAFAAALRTLAPVLLMLPLLALLTWRIVGRALEPLNRLAREVGARTPAALESIPEAGAPEEAIPLVRALNRLLARLDATLAAQRAFVADAAHELRTPLAALELQRQLVERAPDAQGRAAALTDLRAGLGRMTRVVQQLLTLARAEPDAGPALAGEPVSLSDLVAQAVADHALLAEAKRIDLGAGRVAEDAVVTGDAGSLRTLLENLVDNAIRYSPRGGRVDVDAGVLAGRPCLEVSDHGPGIPEAERARVFDRFYRHGGGSDTGSGLGLAIVKAIVERHRASVSLRDTLGGGLTVRVEFPARQATPACASVASPVPVERPNGDGRP